MTDVIKDQELMPPPSSSLNHEYVMQCDNSNSTINNTRKFIETFITFTVIIFVAFLPSIHTSTYNLH